MFLSPFNRTNEEWADVRAIFQGLMLEMENRGGDGCGFAVIKDDGTVISHLRLPLVRVHEAIVMKAWREALSSIGPGTRAVIGHTRLATTGNVKDEENFHPFHTGNIIGAHNGTVLNHIFLARHLGVEKELKGSCDSEVIFATINLLLGNRHLNSETIDLVMDCADASYALTLMDTRDPNRIFLVKGDNPLYVNYDKRLDMRAWASTAEAFVTAYNLVNLRRTSNLEVPVPYFKPVAINFGTGWEINTKTIHTQDEFEVPIRVRHNYEVSHNTHGWFKYSKQDTNDLQDMAEYYQDIEVNQTYGVAVSATKPLKAVRRG